MEVYDGCVYLPNNGPCGLTYQLIHFGLETRVPRRPPPSVRPPFPIHLCRLIARTHDYSIPGSWRRVTRRDTKVPPVPGHPFRPRPVRTERHFPPKGTPQTPTTLLQTTVVLTSRPWSQVFVSPERRDRDKPPYASFSLYSRGEPQILGLLRIQFLTSNRFRAHLQTPSGVCSRP